MNSNSRTPPSHRPGKVPINLQLPIEQHKALKQKAVEKSTTVQALIRLAVAGQTGVADPTRRYTPPTTET